MPYKKHPAIPAFDGWNAIATPVRYARETEEGVWEHAVPLDGPYTVEDAGGGGNVAVITKDGDEIARFFTGGHGGLVANGAIGSTARLVRASWEMLQLLKQANSGEYDANAVAHSNWLAQVERIVKSIEE